MQHTKVLIIGLDGGTWKVFEPLIKEGAMPNLKRLVDNGCSGICKSTYPPITAPAWASFQTGKNPGKHGVYDFIVFNKDRNKDILVNYNFLKGQTLWDFLTEYGKRCIVINVPLTYPTPKINGLFISGFPCTKLNEDMVYPIELYPELLRQGYKLFSISKELIKHVSVKEFVDSQIETESKRYEIALKLIKENDFDVFMVHNQCMDGLQHALLHRILDNKAEDWPIIKKFYKITDEYIGKLMRTVGNDTYIFVLSDHGHTLAKKYIDLNSWLNVNGYLKNTVPNSVFVIYEFLKRNRVFSKIRSLLRQRVKAIGKRSIFKMINKDKSIAFSGGNIFGGIYILDNNNKNKYLDEIKKKVMELKDDSTNRKVIKKVYSRDEIYNGDFIDSAPDLLIEPADGYIFRTDLKMKKNIITEIDYKTDLSGTHDMDGIFCIYGSFVKTGNCNTEIIDFFPTILSLMDIPIPDDVDGKVLKHCFNIDMPISYSRKSIDINDINTSVYSSENEESIKKQLKDLGYL